MDINQQNRLADRWNIKLGMEYRGRNGARVIPHSASNCPINGPYIHYRASHPDMDGGKWAEGDMTPNAMHRWIFGGE